MGASAVLFVVLFPAVIAAVIFYSWRWYRRQAAGWADAAQQMGLRYQPGAGFAPGRISGVLKGYGVSVEQHTEGSGNTRQTCTRYRVIFPHRLPVDIHISPQGPFQGIANLFGSQDIRVGDRDFDELVVIKGSNEEDVQNYLTEVRRRQLAALWGPSSAFSFSSEGIVVHSGSAHDNSESIVSWVETLVHAARIFCPVVKPKKSAPGPSFEEVDPEWIVSSDALDEQAPEPILESDIEHVDDFGPDGVFLPPEPEPAASTEELCKNLFEQKNAAQDAYLAYVDRPLCLEGELTDVRPFDVDFDFDGRSGVRATFRLGDVETSPGIRGPVRAIAAFDREAGRGLEALKGRPVTFRGVLRKKKDLLRELYLDDSALVEDAAAVTPAPGVSSSV